MGCFTVSGMVLTRLKLPLSKGWGLKMPQSREEQEARIRAWMQADYLPSNPSPSADNCAANALEYIAYHMGQISRQQIKITAELEQIKLALGTPRG